MPNERGRSQSQRRALREGWENFAMSRGVRIRRSDVVERMVLCMIPLDSACERKQYKTQKTWTRVVCAICCFGIFEFWSKLASGIFQKLDQGCKRVFHSPTIQSNLGSPKGEAIQSGSFHGVLHTGKGITIYTLARTALPGFFLVWRSYLSLNGPLVTAHRLQ